MTTLSRLQSDFQNHLLRLEGAAEELIVDTERVNARTRLSIYAEAYRLRLLEALDANFPLLHRWVGDEQFQNIGCAYIEAEPSRHYNIRYFGDRLARFLSSTEPFAQTPALSEMANFEWAMTLAFDAPDAAAVSIAEIGEIPPKLWPAMKFTLHASVQRLDLNWNVAAVWKALQNDVQPPQPEAQTTPTAWVIWRQRLSPYFRSLDVTEAWALDAAGNGEDFSAVCEGLCEWIDAQHVATHAAGLLKRWAADGLIAKITTNK